MLGLLELCLVCWLFLLPSYAASAEDEDLLVVTVSGALVAILVFLVSLVVMAFLVLLVRLVLMGIIDAIDAMDATIARLQIDIVGAKDVVASM